MPITSLALNIACLFPFSPLRAELPERSRDSSEYRDNQNRNNTNPSRQGARQAVERKSPAAKQWPWPDYRADSGIAVKEILQYPAGGAVSRFDMANVAATQRALLHRSQAARFVLTP
ncbi:hypothetical protein [Xanthomonas sacchari]|uniref:hypothetical protein n=1 Tax=Xanthomonas sacchari TaxID=56458 RepID=UPI003526D586